MVYGDVAGYDTKVWRECGRVTASIGIEKVSDRMDMAA
jgi:hypothetical protein